MAFPVTENVVKPVAVNAAITKWLATELPQVWPQ